MNVHQSAFLICATDFIAEFMFFVCLHYSHIPFKICVCVVACVCTFK